MESSTPPADPATLRGQSAEAKSLRVVIQETTKLWRKHHLTYDQTKQVVTEKWRCPAEKGQRQAELPASGAHSLPMQRRPDGPRRGPRALLHHAVGRAI